MNNWSNTFLQAKSHIGDPAADDAVRSVFESGGIDQVNALMVNLVANDDLLPTGLPATIQDYLIKTAVLPAWTDSALLARGLSVFNVHGPEVVMLLFGASLPVVYADPMISRVLALTTRLTQHAFRRIIETAQFVVDVTAPDAFAETGRGIRTIQKVRLMHAAIRHLIVYDPHWLAEWDNTFGVPISQLHLIGTLLSFSTTVLQGLALMNIHIEADDCNAFMHLWKVIGHVLGVQDDLLPEDYPESIRLMDQWRKQFQADTPAGRQLTAALLNLIDSYLKDPVSKGLIINWIRIWIGQTPSNLLAVPSTNWTQVFVPIERAVFGWLERTEYESKFLTGLARGISRDILIGAVDFERGGNRPQFRMSGTLQEAEGMDQLKAKLAGQS
jgi:hypothetical protein